MYTQIIHTAYLMTLHLQKLYLLVVILELSKSHIPFFFLEELILFTTIFALPIFLVRYGNVIYSIR